VSATWADEQVVRTIAKHIFCIDATFIFHKAARTFLSAPLIVVDGEDRTFVYGVIRDLLRLRMELGIRRGILVVGSEAQHIASDDNISAAISFIRDMALPLVYDPKQKALDICYHLSSATTHLVTGDPVLIQLASDGLSVIVPTATEEHECLTPERVLVKMGVTPHLIPTFAALHGPGKRRQNDGTLTKRQAIRLIELYGDLDNIYENLDTLGSAAVRRKLASGRDVILRRYKTYKIQSRDAVTTVATPQNVAWNINNGHVKALFRDSHFYSLSRLLPLPKNAKPLAAVEVRDRLKYRMVSDSEGLRDLAAAMRSSSLCALDAESDSKDPRKATLLGVALSARQGEAFFVPFLERDLSDGARSQVVSTLKRILSKRLRVVGHNIKYDAVLLKRNGIDIGNVFFDTMLAAYECYGDSEFFNLSFLADRLLSKRIRRYGEIVKKGETFLDLPLREVMEHGCQDADVTLQVYAALELELEKRGIRDQYENGTLALAHKLIDIETNGITVDLKELGRARGLLIDKIATAKDQVEKKLGRKLDLDSTKDLAAALNEHLALRSAFGPKSVTLRRLEELAIPYDDVRSVVEYKRLGRQIRRLESIIAAARDGRVFPLFNQVRAPSGRLCSTSPNLFEEDGLDLLRDCFASTVRPFFRDPVAALDLLQDESGDRNLETDRGQGGGRNHFMEQHALMKSLDHVELLLSVVSGESGPAISRRFMVERMQVDMVCHDLRMRYGKLFEWLDEYRAKTGRCGYAEGPKGRKYLEGLGSSSLEKRRNASNAAVRWFIDL